MTLDFLILMLNYNYNFFKQTSFSDVNTNNASSLKENIILTNLVPKYGEKLWHQYGHGVRGGTPGMTILTRVMCMCPQVEVTEVGL